MGNNHWKYAKKNTFRLAALSLKREGVDNAASLIASVCEKKDKMIK